ncbi:DUF4252 domain-containing protein [Marinicella sp. W31]|uniref:DUF4252 domain-containing protein n=1 Tax=Marinicella sp. W31 TaxID=3023713 RepID=UPI003756A434
MKYLLPLILLLLLFGCDRNEIPTPPKPPELDTVLPQEPNVEVNLGPAMLNLLGSMTEEDQQISNIVQGLSRISVKVYDLDDHEDLDLDALKNALDQQAKWLKSQSYQPLASLREDDSVVYIMGLMSDNSMKGIQVYSLDDDDELILINIDGELLLNDLSKLMEHFDVNIKDLDL